MRGAAVMNGRVSGHKKNGKVPEMAMKPTLNYNFIYYKGW